MSDTDIDSQSGSSIDTPEYRYTSALAQDIEVGWQDFWAENGTFHTPNPVGALANPDRTEPLGEKVFV
ncbi:MAG: leucyl-tRNA synthetase, partial [Ilumatobacter sp.]